MVLLDAEKEGFVDYLNKLLPIVRPGGLIIAHDSSGEAHKMHDYFKTIAAHPDLESVMVDPSRWGMCITRKMMVATCRVAGISPIFTRNPTPHLTSQNRYAHNAPPGFHPPYRR